MTHRSEVMSDRVCIRGCSVKDLHFASCRFHGPDYKGAFPCHGCAPRECRDGSLICDRCFGRMRALFADIFDLLGQMRAKGDPLKAAVYDRVKVIAAASQASAPIGDDLLDALMVVEEVVVVWELWRRDLQMISNDAATVEWLGPRLLDRHPSDGGVREAWSVSDAMRQWGAERRDRDPVEWDDDDDRAEVVEPIAEWGDELAIVGREDAEAVAGSPSTLRRWIKNGSVAVVGEAYIAGRLTRLFRRAELLACRERMRDQMWAGRPKITSPLNRTQEES